MGTEPVPPPAEARVRQLLRAQAVVDQAQEILMARLQCGPDMAFELLWGASQFANVKVHEIAERLVEPGWSAPYWDDDQGRPG